LNNSNENSDKALGIEFSKKGILRHKYEPVNNLENLEPKSTVFHGI
jgi:hypothetical protein